MEITVKIFTVVITFLLMEAVAWLSHKYVMHGFLWFFHEDHHQHNRNLGPFELNDFFFLIFAFPGIVLICIGLDGLAVSFFIGLGITLYGFAYFLVHDIFIHRRLKWLRNINWHYFKSIRRAHKAHHKHLYKDGGECFGMLWVPRKYFNKKNE